MPYQVVFSLHNLPVAVLKTAPNRIPKVQECDATDVEVFKKLVTKEFIKVLPAAKKRRSVCFPLQNLIEPVNL
jgi:hypothetical protein